jgi:ABC-type glutathione transport system ATPase component
MQHLANLGANVSELRQQQAHAAAAIEVAGLSHVYVGREGQVPALEDIALTVGAGRFVVIVGPSGCGKTSLLMMMAGLRHQTSGVGLRHGVIHTRRVTRHETREHLLRGWSILRLSHHRRLPLTRPHEMGRGTAESVTKQRQGRDDEPYDVSRDFVL